MNIDFTQLFSNWFFNSSLYKPYQTVKVVFVVLDILVVVSFVSVFMASLRYRPRFYFHPWKKKEGPIKVKDQKLVKQWQLIIEKSKANPPQSLVLAIIEADKLVDEVLKKMGLGGEHMADRLEKLGAWELKTLEKLWRAHRLRNELVHQPEFDISPVDAKEVLIIYESFLQELEVI